MVSFNDTPRYNAGGKTSSSVTLFGRSPRSGQLFFLLLPILHELILVALNSYLSWHLAWTHSGLPQIARRFQRLFCFSSSYCRLFFFWFSLKFFIAVNMSCPVILSLSPAGSLSFYGPWRPSANPLPARCLLAPVQIQLYNSWLRIIIISIFYAARC